MDKRILITIGRQFGSGGKCIADAMGRILGVPVYDNELITRAAQKSGLSADVFRKSDERRRFSLPGGLLGSLRYGSYTRNVLGDSELYRYQSEAILDLASQGSAVFVGRASDYVLREQPVFNVFITAPLEARKARVAERKAVSLEEAEQLIHKMDARRKDFYDLITLGDNWGIASRYHLCVDSSLLGEDGTAQLIVDVALKSGRF